MTLDGMAFGSHGRATTPGPMHGLQFGTWGKTQKEVLFIVVPFQLDLSSGVLLTANIDLATVTAYEVIQRVALTADEQGQIVMVKRIGARTLKHILLHSPTTIEYRFMTPTEVMEDLLK